MRIFSYQIILGGSKRQKFTFVGQIFHWIFFGFYSLKISFVSVKFRNWNSMATRVTRIFLRKKATSSILWTQVTSCWLATYHGFYTDRITFFWPLGEVSKSSMLSTGHSDLLLEKWFDIFLITLFYFSLFEKVDVNSICHRFFFNIFYFFGYLG